MKPLISIVPQPQPNRQEQTKSKRRERNQLIIGDKIDLTPMAMSFLKEERKRDKANYFVRVPYLLIEYGTLLNIDYEELGFLVHLFAFVSWDDKTYKAPYFSVRYASKYRTASSELVGANIRKRLAAKGFIRLEPTKRHNMYFYNLDKLFGVLQWLRDTLKSIPPDLPETEVRALVKVRFNFFSAETRGEKLH